MKKYLILSLFTIIFDLHAVYDAVCTVPIADLVGVPFKTSVEKNYKDLYLEGYNHCAIRMGQLLFNERVKVLETFGNECKIKVRDHFYSTPTKKKSRTYWTMKINLRNVDDIDATAIPQPFVKQQNKNIIVLHHPFYDHQHHRHYSAGTRFILTPQQKNKRKYMVYTLAKNYQKTTIAIPKKYCYTYASQPKKQINRFLKILKSYAHQRTGHIPYVWGGMSYNAPYRHHFKEIKIYKNGKLDHFFETKKPLRSPYSGPDCAGLIIRCAQIAGMPLYAKNSTALLNTLKPLKKGETIKNGDIIYMPGHVMVISNKDKNQIIESRTQCHGYGYVHEIPLSEEFPEIKTIHDLQKIHHAKKAIRRIDKKGTTVCHTPLTILKLSSLYRTS